ncbi:protein neprosin-like [Bidens hawaiensis]|uniref:protein neprosin-like n=1 Tax=Bidens hawaiensis TaxID=980011 RepID=UPI004049BD3C
MRSSYCHEIIPSLISALVCSFFLFSPIYVVKGIENLWQENENSMSGDEYKKMKLINSSVRKINKPFVKSIQSPDGDIIDCVLIHLQPAFDLPELRGTMPLHALGCLLGKKYHGIKAIVNVWAPNIANKDDYSNSQIWVISRIPNHDVNVIEVGWMVYPGLFGDKSPRLFIYWTGDGYKSGYTICCVQDSSKRDLENGNWWLSMDGDQIGYWPSTLFTDLRDHATMIQFGGEVFDNGVTGQHTSTQMGSGHFPGEGFGKAAFISNIELIDGATTISPNLSDIVVVAEKANCYDVTSGYEGLFDHYVFFGGPGKSPKCP